jgi:glycine/D-amino acid oxidase-like deaminating enzyme
VAGFWNRALDLVLLDMMWPGFDLSFDSILPSSFILPIHRQALESTRVFVARVFPHLDPTPTHTLKCLYSVTPDHDFVLDAHPTLPHVRVRVGLGLPRDGGFRACVLDTCVSPALGGSIDCVCCHSQSAPAHDPPTIFLLALQVYVAAGFSGHGYKFGSALGEIMASLALGAPLPPSLDQAMANGRFSLKRFDQQKKGEGKPDRNVYR